MQVYEVECVNQPGEDLSVAELLTRELLSFRASDVGSVVLLEKGYANGKDCSATYHKFLVVVK